MSRSLDARSEVSQLTSAQDGSREEVTGVSNRVLIIGANSVGAYTLKNKFLQFLKEKGIHNPTVQTVGGPESLEVAFFTGGLPKGVILLSWFRWYDSRGAGNTLPTYGSGFDKDVEKLCLQHDVPLIKMEGVPSENDVSANIQRLLGA